MDTVNVNVKKSRINSSSRKTGSAFPQEAETSINIGDNLFTLMLVAISAFGLWAVTAVLLL